jgi:hypothetical protein
VTDVVASEPGAEPAITARSSPPRPVGVHLATPNELESWEATAVASPSGHVYQSRTWAEYRAAHGWQPWHLAFDDGFRLLVLGRPRSVAGGGSAYASRGPIPEANPEISAQRAAAAAELLAGEGMDELIVDGETPAESGLGRQLARAGFEPTEELQ